MNKFIIIGILGAVAASAQMYWREYGYRVTSVQSVPLSDEHKEALKKAKAAVDKAVAEMEETREKIRAAYGQTPGRNPSTSQNLVPAVMYVCSDKTDVQIENDDLVVITKKQPTEDCGKIGLGEIREDHEVQFNEE